MFGSILSSEMKCTVTQKIWLTPSVFVLRFSPSKKFEFEPGQFVSVTIPDQFMRNIDGRRIRRLYSMNCALEQGYELCIKQTGGPGPCYLASLEEGDTLSVSGPYGEFMLQPSSAKNICFISTGTGIAPLRSMMLSRSLREAKYENVKVLFGAKEESEILFEAECKFLGYQYIAAISHPQGPLHEPNHFHGRVTQYLSSLPPGSFEWGNTDFYLCGNGAMINEVTEILTKQFAVKPERIFSESYFGARKAKETQQIEAILKASA